MKVEIAVTGGSEGEDFNSPNEVAVVEGRKGLRYDSTNEPSRVTAGNTEATWWDTKKYLGAEKSSVFVRRSVADAEVAVRMSAYQHSRILSTTCKTLAICPADMCGTIIG